MQNPGAVGAFFASAICLSACAAPDPGGDIAAAALPPPADPVAVRALAPPERPAFTQTGVASWYGRAFQHKPTASGEPYEMGGLTAAHRSLPLQTRVRVTNIRNGRTVTVRIDDRGPFLPGRIIDLSARAAHELGMRRAGLARVTLEVFAADQPAERVAAARPEAAPRPVSGTGLASSFRSPFLVSRLEAALFE